MHSSDLRIKVLPHLDLLCELGLCERQRRLLAGVKVQLVLWVVRPRNEPRTGLPARPIAVCLGWFPRTLQQ